MGEKRSMHRCSGDPQVTLGGDHLSLLVVEELHYTIYLISTLLVALGGTSPTNGHSPIHLNPPSKPDFAPLDGVSGGDDFDLFFCGSLFVGTGGSPGSWEPQIH